MLTLMMTIMTTMMVIMKVMMMFKFSFLVLGMGCTIASTTITRTTMSAAFPGPQIIFF